MNEQDNIYDALAADEHDISLHAGWLYLVGTPIGNLQDLTRRAATVLAHVDLIAAEDTRRTLKLLNHLAIRKKMVSYHAHNWRSKSPQLIERLLAGETIALVTDAGMPAISDPGSELVALCISKNIAVQVIPGPCAAITGLAGSGLPSDRFAFEGFLPASGKERRNRLDELPGEKSTMVFYEAPHRLKRTLRDFTAAGLSDRRLTLARELTKKHESYIHVSVDEALTLLDTEPPRGEYVLVLEGMTEYARRCPPVISQSEKEADINLSIASVIDLVESGLSLKQACIEVAEKRGLRKNQLYQAVLRANQDDKPLSE